MSRCGLSTLQRFHMRCDSSRTKTLQQNCCACGQKRRHAEVRGCRGAFELVGSHFASSFLTFAKLSWCPCGDRQDCTSLRRSECVLFGNIQLDLQMCTSSELQKKSSTHQFLLLFFFPLEACEQLRSEGFCACKRLVILLGLQQEVRTAKKHKETILKFHENLEVLRCEEVVNRERCICLSLPDEQPTFQ